MGRIKGSKNRNSAETPTYMTLTIEERIAALANLIIDRIGEDQQEGGPLLKQILESENVRPNSA